MVRHPLTTPQTTVKPDWPFPEAHLTLYDDQGYATRHYARLWPAPNGQWAKKHKGKRYHFGVWKDPHAALDDWKVRWPGILAGEPDAAVRHASPVHTVLNLSGEWLEHIQRAVARGDRSHYTYLKYRYHAKRFVAAVGRQTPLAELAPEPRPRNAPAKFTKAARAANGLALPTRNDYFVAIRAMFNYGVEQGYLAIAPRYGPEFKPAERGVVRRYRQQNARQLPTPLQVHRLLDACSPPELPLVLLGLNAGLKAEDFVHLGPAVLDLDAGLLDGYRHKSSIPQLAPLWPETVLAIRRVCHPETPSLRTPRGSVWAGRHGNLARVWRRRRLAAGLPDWFTHSVLRHVAVTVGGRVSRDDTRRVVGQQVGDVLDETYDHNRYLEPARRVTDHIRAWLCEGVTDPGASRPDKPLAPGDAGWAWWRLVRDAGAPGKRRTRRAPSPTPCS